MPNVKIRIGTEQYSSRKNFATLLIELANALIRRKKRPLWEQSPAYTGAIKLPKTDYLSLLPSASLDYPMDG